MSAVILFLFWYSDYKYYTTQLIYSWASNFLCQESTHCWVADIGENSGEGG